MIGSRFVARTKEEVEYEREFAEKHLNSEVKTTVLSKEEIERMYGAESEIKRKALMVPDFKRHYVQIEEGGRKVIFNIDIVKEDLRNGLCKGEIFAKYDVPSNVKSRFFNQAAKLLVKEGILTEDQVKVLRRTEVEGENEMSKVEDLVGDATIEEIIMAKETVKEVETVQEIKAKKIGMEKVGELLESEESVNEVAKEIEKKNVLKVKRVEIEGTVLSYAVKERAIDLMKGAFHVSINKDNLDNLISELTELKSHIGE